MGRYKKIKNKEVIRVYEAKGCNVSATCIALGIDRKTLFNWRNADEKLNEMMCEAEESLLDFSESKLMEQINDGNLTAIIFHLKTKGRGRGYVEQTDVNANVKTFDLRPLSDNELDALREFYHSKEEK
ncbi:MAG: hypothetical protein K6G25_06465 [Bacteroidales bacterium]|nr:hypothetical protein [Bacteroidales bacterium]